MKNKIMLSFDVEEFDLPNEYNMDLKLKDQLEVSRKGLEEVISILSKLGIKATFFVTANFAKNHRALIKKISKEHEIASHGYFHSEFSDEDLEKSKKEIEKITGKKVKGFRMPRLKDVSSKKIREAGYLYNSSSTPTWIPGRYNRILSKRKIHEKDGIVHFPTSVLPFVRLPLFWWISFKHIPLKMSSFFARKTLRYDGFLNIYFHPWEFVNLDNFKIPRYIKKNSGEKMATNLENYLKDLKKEGKFIFFSDLLK